MPILAASVRPDGAGSAAALEVAAAAVDAADVVLVTILVGTTVEVAELVAVDDDVVDVWSCP
jgi:hypothetical protein